MNDESLSMFSYSLRTTMHRSGAGCRIIQLRNSLQDENHKSGVFKKQDTAVVIFRLKRNCLSLLAFNN